MPNDEDLLHGWEDTHLGGLGGIEHNLTPGREDAVVAVDEILDLLSSVGEKLGDFPLVKDYLYKWELAAAIDVLRYEQLELFNRYSDREWQWMDGCTSAEVFHLVNDALVALGEQPVDEEEASDRADEEFGDY